MKKLALVTCALNLAKDLQDNVNQMYFEFGNRSQSYEKQLKLWEIQQGGESVTKYFNILEGLWQDLDLFNDYEQKNVEDQNHFNKMLEFLGLQVFGWSQC